MGSAIKLPGPSTVFAPKDNPTFTGVVTTPNATIGSLAGILTGVAGVMGAKALGAADLKLFMNAAGADIEFAKGIKTGLFTRDLTTASGTQSITGVGFKPSQGSFKCGLNGAGAMSTGNSNGTDNHMVVLISAVGYFNNAACIGYFVDLSNYQTAVISTWGSDGFTVTWTKVGSPTGTLYTSYQVYR